MNKTEIQVIKDNLKNYESKQSEYVINFLNYLISPSMGSYKGDIKFDAVKNLETSGLITIEVKSKHSFLGIKFGQKTIVSSIRQRGIDWLKEELENQCQN